MTEHARLAPALDRRSGKTSRRPPACSPLAERCAQRRAFVAAAQRRDLSRRSPLRWRAIARRRRLERRRRRALRLVPRSARPGRCSASGTRSSASGCCTARRDGIDAGRALRARRRRADPIASRTAILMTLRNEDPGARVPRGCATVKRSLDATGEGERFAYFILSDTSTSSTSPRRRRRRRRLAREAGADAARIVYRRRTDNTGFKAGNVRDFCERWGGDYELMLPLDADSLMSGEAIVRLVAHDAGPSEARHPAEPRRRHAVRESPSRASSSSACATACAPTRWARPGGSAIAARSGAITRSCGSRPSATIAICRSCPAGRRSAATCCRMTRSRRR